MNPSNNKSTNELALASVPSAVQALLKLRIRHTRIQQVMDELDTLIYPGSQDSILMVCGPTGAGKSTLAKHMVASENEQSVAAMDADAGLVPAVYVEAKSSGEDEFSWRQFYIDVLTQLGPDLNLPKYHFGVDASTGRMVSSQRPKDNTLSGLRTAVENSLRNRKTRFLVIDEAAHIIHQTPSSRLEIQLDTLKSLANLTGAQIVMVGSYDLYQLMSLSGQLSRRTHVLHLERYREDSDVDLRAFRTCVQKFESTAPQLWGGQLMQYSGALHENTLGCIGTLSGVLTRSAKLAEKAGGWSVEHLQRALLTELQRKKILEEILDGEAAINPGLTRVLPKSSQRSRSGTQRQRAA